MNNQRSEGMRNQMNSSSRIVYFLHAKDGKSVRISRVGMTVLIFADTTQTRLEIEWRNERQLLDT